ncbi:hypothetical protein [Streptomyces alboflavus]|uniref:hypothetical protein n=1 Tax=Streptomyces alboflavus TaxID=67267 RepID=UPI0036958146
MLTYLATALPRSCSPTTRLLALQCALRADAYGQVALPGGFLRGLRLNGHATPWHELEHAQWLRCTHRRHGHIRAQLLDSPALNQAPGRNRRARAAHWALHPAPLATAHQAPPSVQLTALALAVHTEGTAGQAGAEDLTRLCATPLSLLEDLLDQLTHAHTLTRWNHHPEGDVILWQLPQASDSSHR